MTIVRTGRAMHRIRSRRQLVRGLSPTPEGHVEWSIIVISFLNATLGVALVFLIHRIIVRPTPEVKFTVEFRNRQTIEQVEWNIATGNSHDRALRRQWRDPVSTEDHRDVVLASNTPAGDPSRSPGSGAPE